MLKTWALKLVALICAGFLVSGAALFPDETSSQTNLETTETTKTVFPLKQRNTGMQSGIRRELATSPSPLIFLGVGGLQWKNIAWVLAHTKNQELKKLWENFIKGSGVANNVVRSWRSLACPNDGWLSLGLGQRAGDTYSGRLDYCWQAQDPQAVKNGYSLSYFPRISTALAEQKLQAQIGAFAQVLGKNSLKVTGFGPGAALALTNAFGQVKDPWFALPEGKELGVQIADASSRNDLVLVDLGNIGREFTSVEITETANNTTTTTSDSQGENSDLAQMRELEQSEAVMEKIASIIAAIPADTSVMVASISDTNSYASLQSLLWRSPEIRPGFLESSGVKHLGITQNSDIPTAILQHFQITKPVDFRGGSLTGEQKDQKRNPANLDELLAQLLATYNQANAARQTIAPFSWVLAISLVLFMGLMALWYYTSRQIPTVIGKTFQKVLAGLALALSQLPLGAQLLTFFGWYQGNPVLNMWIIIVVIVSLLSVVFGLILKLLSTRLEKPAQVWATITLLSAPLYLYFIFEALRGGSGQFDAPLGVSSLAGARFYGLNNTAFALFLTSGLLLAHGLAQLLRHLPASENTLGKKKPLGLNKKNWGVLIIIAVGLLSAGLDGLPRFGADFGGPPAILPAFLLSAAWYGGIKISYKSLTLIGGFTLTVVASISLADYLRPPNQRSHLGNFVQSIMDGQLTEVLMSKAGRNLHNLLNSHYTIVVLVALIFAFTVLRPILKEKTWHKNVSFAPLGLALFTGHLLGYFINDSGILITAMGVALLIPLAGVVSLNFASPQSLNQIKQ